MEMEIEMEMDAEDEKPFDLDGGGVIRLVKKLWNYKANKLYKKLNKETESLQKIHDSLISKAKEVDQRTKELLFNAFNILNIVINANLDSDSNSQSSSHNIQREREDFFKKCVGLKKHYLSIRELEKEFYSQYNNARRVDDLVTMMNKKKLDAAKAKYESSSKSPNRMFPKSKYGDELGTNPIIEDIAASSAQSELATKTKKLEDLKTAVEKALKENMFTGNFFVSSEDLDSNTKYNESINKVKALLDGGDNAIYEIFCDEEKIKSLIRYYYFKSSGSTNSIIEFESGNNSIIFPDIPIVLQYLFHNFNKSEGAKCFVTQKLFTDPEILNNVVTIKTNLLQKLKSLFADITPDIFNNGVSYSLLFHSILYGRNVNSIKVLLGSMIMTAIDLINDNNDIEKPADVSVIIERYILKFEYQKLLLMCWNMFTASSINISSDYLRLVLYKLLDTTAVPAFLNLKDGELTNDFFKKSEETRFNQQLDALKSLDLQSSDIFMLMDVSSKSMESITKEFSDSYHNVNHGYHLSLLKKHIKQEKKSVLEKGTATSDFFITRAVFNDQEYLLVNLYIPFMKTTLEERSTVNACETKFSSILRILGEQLKGKDNVPIIVFASLNYEFMKKDLKDIKKESDNGGEHHTYLDFGAGAFQIIELPPSIYYFDYNIIKCNNESRNFLRKIFDEKERNQNLDYLFYKFPESMKDFKIHIKSPSPYKKTYNVIIENIQKVKEKESEEETVAAPENTGYIEVELTESSESKESDSGIFTSSYTVKNAIDSKYEVKPEEIAKYQQLCGDLGTLKKRLGEINKDLAEKNAEFESLKRRLETTKKDYDAKFNDLQALLPNIFEEVTSGTPLKPLDLADDANRKTLLDAIISLFDSDGIKFEKDTTSPKGKDTYLKIGGHTDIKGYKIKLKNDYKDQLKAADFRKLYEGDKFFNENKDKIDATAELPTKIEESKKESKGFNDEIDKQKREFDELVETFNANKLTAENWNFIEKQPSNHQLCSIEIVKKDAKISGFEKDIVPQVKKILEEHKISQKDFKIYSSTIYNKFLYLSAIFDTLGITSINGIDIEKYVNSVINLYKIKDKKLYKPDDFKPKDALISVGISGGGKVESPKRNILIKMLNSKSIDYGNLKLKRRTNKRRLGNVYKHSRRRHSKHKVRSKRA